MVLISNLFLSNIDDFNEESLSTDGQETVSLSVEEPLISSLDGFELFPDLQLLSSFNIRAITSEDLENVINAIAEEEGVREEDDEALSEATALNDINPIEVGGSHKPIEDDGRMEMEETEEGRSSAAETILYRDTVELDELDKDEGINDYGMLRFYRYA